MAFLQTIVLTPSRVRVILDGPVSPFTPGILAATNWTVTRVDGSGGRQITVGSVWQRDTTGLELALSLDLPPHILFTFSYSPAGSGQAQWAPPVEQINVIQTEPSPEDEVFGIDMDWFAAALDASGDMPLARGRECLRHDLVAIAKTHPGELFHRPTEGGGLLSKLKGVDGTSRAQGEIGSALVRIAKNDPRVRDAKVSITRDGKGAVTATITAQPIAIDESVITQARV